jgi:hypothetical protein
MTDCWALGRIEIAAELAAMFGRRPEQDFGGNCESETMLASSGLSSRPQAE